ncbi:MAG: single-stranded DNA-binding protein [bacterium]
MNLNKVFLIGRLTRDPESKALPSGQSVTSFGLATDNFYTDKSGQKQQQTEFHNIVAFGRLADIASQYLAKGSLVLIEGRLRTRNWQDSSGSQRYRTEITAERLQLGPKSANKTAPAQGEARSSRFTDEASREQSLSREQKETSPQEDIPIIEENEEINVKDLPF